MQVNNSAYNEEWNIERRTVLSSRFKVLSFHTILSFQYSSIPSFQQKKPSWCRKALDHHHNVIKFYSSDSFLLKKSSIWSLWTISSLKIYVPVSLDFTIFMTCEKFLPTPERKVATAFFAMNQFILSPCVWYIFSVSDYIFSFPVDQAYFSCSLL